VNRVRLLAARRTFAAVKSTITISTSESSGSEVLARAAFAGQTPGEIYFGRGADVPESLAWQREEARQSRLERNRQAVCSCCPRNGREELAA